jgi:hypothetical protein
MTTRLWFYDLRQYSKKLAGADERAKMNFEVSPSGYGIHWPDLDEDLSIDGLLGIVHAPPQRLNPQARTFQMA